MEGGTMMILMPYVCLVITSTSVNAQVPPLTLCCPLLQARVQGSDANMYVYFGASFDVAGSVTEVDTGGWIGPYSLLLPDDDNTTKTNAGVTKIRYVKSPQTELLQR